MSVLWFFILLLLYEQGLEASDTTILLIGIFYIGDCILMMRKKG